MKHVLNFILLIALASSFGNCRKCYDCKKQIVIEDRDGNLVKTDVYDEEEACKNREKDKYEDDGYTCTSQL